MKRNIKFLSSFFVILAFAFSLAIIPASNCHATSIKPINIKQIFDPPPEPYIDDGEPGLDPDIGFNYLKNSYYITGTCKNKDANITIINDYHDVIELLSKYLFFVIYKQIIIY